MHTDPQSKTQIRCQKTPQSKTLCSQKHKSGARKDPTFIQHTVARCGRFSGAQTERAPRISEPQRKRMPSSM